MHIRLIRVLLDANVLVDAQIRDLMLRAAEDRLIDVRWSAEIIAETRRALTGRLGLPVPAVDRLVGAIATEFPEAQVVGHEVLVDALHLPDPHDRHVLAAAIHGECDLLATFNVRDFPQALIPADADLRVVSPDEALRALVDDAPEAMAAMTLRVIRNLRRPPSTTLTFIKRLEERTPIAAAALGAALGLPDHIQIYEQILASEREGAPQQAVATLIDALARGDAPTVAASVSQELSQRLTGDVQPEAGQVLEALWDALGDVLTEPGWGLATAHRIHAPGVELVKLIQVGERPRIAHGPQWARGHLLYLRSGPDGWTLVDLDGDDPADPGETVPIANLRERLPGTGLVEVPDEEAPADWPAPLHLAAAFAAFLDSERRLEDLRLLVTPESLPAWLRDLAAVTIPEDYGLATGVILARDAHHAQVQDVCYVRFVRVSNPSATYRVDADLLTTATVLTLQWRPELGTHFDGWRIFGIGDPVRPEEIPGRTP
jgi:predicted nucleic acid-binding protein